MADLELITKGIVQAIGQYSNQMAQRAAIENQFVQNEIEFVKEMRKEKAKALIQRQTKAEEREDEAKFQEDWMSKMEAKKTPQMPEALQQRFPTDINKIVSPVAMPSVRPPQDNDQQSTALMSPSQARTVSIATNRPLVVSDWQTAIQKKIAEKAEQGMPITKAEQEILEPKDTQQKFIDRMNEQAPKGFQYNPNYIPGKSEDRWIKKDKEALQVNPLNVDQQDREYIDEVSKRRMSGEKIEPQEVLSNIDQGLAVGIKGLLDYDTDPMSLSTRNNSRWDMIKMSKMIDPNYQPSLFKRRNNYLNTLQDGKSRIWQQKTSLNTVAQHLAQFDGYIDALGGGNLKPKNAIINFAKDLTGDPSITNYNTAKEAVNNEIERLLTGVGVTQEAMKRWNEIISPNTGYTAKKAQMKALIKLIEGRVSALKQDFTTTMGREENGEILFPESKEIFDKYLKPRESQYQPGQRITRNGKEYTVQIDENGRPYIEE